MAENPRGFVPETQWAQKQARMEALWAQRAQGRLQAADGVSLAYAHLAPDERRARAVVVSPGRTEFLDKYIELVFDLNQQGYACYLLDHRGQGGSDRLLADPHKGHVGRFDDYVDDLALFLREVVAPREEVAPVLLGHSMGGAIVARYLQRYPGRAAAGVLCAPMCEIDTGAPAWLVRPLVAMIEALASGLGGEPGYVPGGKGYRPIPFREGGRLNALTTSERRFDYFCRQYEAQPGWQLGSPTRQWLLEAFDAMRALHRDAAALREPLALLVADDDRIVRPRGAVALAQALERARGEPLPRLQLAGTGHELLMESDCHRLPALHFALDFIESLDGGDGVQRSG